jgi:hypothetical protein
MDVILTNHKHLFNFKDIDKKNKIMYQISISTIILNRNKKYTSNNSTINMNKLINETQFFDKTGSILNICFNFFDFNNPNIGQFLKDFLYVYRNKQNQNSNIEEIIKNFNKLVFNRIRKIVKNIDKNPI